jgi:hypothetical protein
MILLKVEQDSHDGAFPNSSLSDGEEGWKYSVNVETVTISAVKIKADVSCVSLIFHIV